MGESKKNVEETAQVSEGGGGGTPGAGAVIPQQPMKKAMTKEIVPHSQWKISPVQIPTLQPVDMP